jgi:hypothetical protein
MNIDTAYQDRQEMIHNLSGGLIEGNEAPKADACPPAQTLPDTWEAIEAQLDHWAEMDREYWRQRKEKEYAAWLERTYGV